MPRTHDIVFSDQALELQATAEEIAEKYVRPDAAKYDKLQEYNWDAARAVGAEAELGSVEPGRLADLVLVRGDPLKQIEAAANVGVITRVRKKKAHDEVRVLANDVLHDDWHEIPEEDVEASRHYCQRILEDFYDDRDSVLTLLRDAKRVPSEDRNENNGES